jgi:hypothetical protein
VKTLARTKKKKNQVALLNRLAHKTGIPFTQWVTQEGSSSKELIIWDSHCRNHNAEGRPKIHIGLQFINNLSEARAHDKKGLTHTRFIHILEEDRTITKRQAPRLDTPLYLNGDQLIYQIELEGNYYAQSIDKSGKLKIVESITPKDYPRTIDCPKALLESANQRKEKVTKNLYLGFFCQRTWNRQTGKHKTLLLPWSCN